MSRMKAYGETIIVAVEEKVKTLNSSVVMPDTSPNYEASIVSLGDKIEGLTGKERILFSKNNAKKFKFKDSEGVAKEYALVNVRDILAILED